MFEFIKRVVQHNMNTGGFTDYRDTTEYQDSTELCRESDRQINELFVSMEKDRLKKIKTRDEDFALNCTYLNKDTYQHLRCFEHPEIEQCKGCSDYTSN